MTRVPPEIMNIVRREMHASETIISADHPDAQPVAETPEQSTETTPVPMMRRILGRFTMDSSVSTDGDKEGRRV